MRLALIAALVATPGLALADRDPWQAGATPQSFAWPTGRVRVQ